MGDTFVEDKKLCTCGCGQITNLGTKYIKGHNIRYLHPTGSKHPRWRGGRQIDKDGYIYIYKPDHPHADHHGCIYEHRLVLEQYLGRYLRADEITHHKNGNKWDNRIENLEVHNRASHAAFHGRKDMSDRICALCKSVKTYFHKVRKMYCWYRSKHGWICNRCYQYNRTHKIVKQRSLDKWF